MTGIVNVRDADDSISAQDPIEAGQEQAMNRHKLCRVHEAAEPNTIEPDVRPKVTVEPSSDEGVLLRSPDGRQLIEASGSLVETFLASGWRVVSEYRV